MQLGVPLKLSQEEHDLLVLKHRLTWINTPEGRVYSASDVVTWRLDPSVSYAVQESLTLTTTALAGSIPRQAKKTLIQLERKLRQALELAQSLERDRRGRLVK